MRTLVTPLPAFLCLFVAGCTANSFGPPDGIAATPLITWNISGAIPYGTALGPSQLDASANVPGSFVYTPSTGTVLTAGSNTLSVTFTPSNTVEYTPATATTTITITQAQPSIAWTPQDPIAVGVPIGSWQLDAAAAGPNSGSVAGSFTYSPGPGTVFNTAGPQTLTATFTPADAVDYAGATASITMYVSAFGVVAWGDSMTQGDKGTVDVNDYPTQLASLLTIPTVNAGVDGNTSTQIGVREGGVPTYATVQGGVIPASGDVEVTFPSGYEPVTAEGPAAGTPGTILGMHGVVTYDSAISGYVFTRSTAGSAVTASGSPQFIVDTPYANYLPVFWEGRDNVGAPTQIISDLKAQIATVPSGQNYLVLSITNDEKSTEWKGGSVYPVVVNDNQQIQALAGSHYLDIREILVNSYDSTQANDVTDFNNDDVPTSLRAIDAQFSLAQPIGPNDTTVYVTPAIAFGLGGNAVLAVDTGANAEDMNITAATQSGNTDIFTVQRGFEGNQTSHAAGTVVLGIDPVHLNGKGTGIVAQAVANYLSAYQKP